MDRFCGIYKIQSKIKSERIYIGSSINIYKRWAAHISLLKDNKHFNNKLQHHYNKYGKEDLVYSIILCCEEDDLLNVEQFFIDSINPWFNLNKNAKFGRKKYSEETIEKMRLKALGRRLSENTKKKIGEKSKGNTNRRGKHHTLEAIIRIKEARAKQVFSEESIHKRNIANTGKKRSPEIRKKFSDIALARIEREKQLKKRQ